MKKKLSQLVSNYDLKVLYCSASDVIDASLVAKTLGGTEGDFSLILFCVVSEQEYSRRNS